MRVTLFSLCVFSALMFSSCLKKSSDLIAETTFESVTGGKNAGFRILPQTAARDALRPQVIYRCNDVQCGEAFQPSNEERDIFIPCDVSLGTSGQTGVKPYVRLVGEGSKQALVEKQAQKKACEKAVPFERLIAEPIPAGRALVQGAPACRVFRRDKLTCESNAGLGCKWVTHPSRNGDPAGGECVGALRSNGSPSTDPNLPGNFQILSGTKPAAPWSDLNAYRAKEANAPVNLK